MKTSYLGVLTWYRTDSYWNPADSMPRSTWGPSNVMSTHEDDKNDNSGSKSADATENGRTYIMAWADGSGVQMVHLSFATTRASSSVSAGTGSTLSTAPANFTNSRPKLVYQNYCATAKITVAGLTDTSSLAQTVKDYSDGYSATINIGLEYFNGGAKGSWRGVCMVYYSS